MWACDMLSRQGSSGRSGVLRSTETHEISPGEHAGMVANHRTKPLVPWANHTKIISQDYFPTSIWLQMNLMNFFFMRCLINWYNH